MKEIMVVISVLIFTIGLSIFGWFVARKINYSVSYKSMVEQTIKDVVKDECLRRVK